MANTTGKKFGGREKGTPNKTTQEIRQVITDFVGNNIDDLQDVYSSLEPDKKLMFFEKMLRFVIAPARDAEEVNDDTISINFIKGAPNFANYTTEELIQRAELIKTIESDPLKTLRDYVAINKSANEMIRANAGIID